MHGMSKTLDCSDERVGISHVGDVYGLVRHSNNG